LVMVILEITMEECHSVQGNLVAQYLHFNAS